MLPTRRSPQARNSSPLWIAIAMAVFLLPGLLACAAAEESAEEADYADRMAAEHADDTPEPSPATEGADDGETTVTREVVYHRADDKEVKGYLAMPLDAAPGTPGLIVIQEWWGLNDNIRAMTRKLAAEGYTALAVDLYEGEVAEDRDGARALMTAALEAPENLEAHLRNAYAYLVEEEGAGDVGSIGWCLGGGWSLRAAQILPGEIDAAVIYYGFVSPDEAALEPITAPIQGHFGAEDRGIPLETVQAFETALENLGKDAEIYVYAGAHHAFANPSGTRYDAAAAEQAWERTLAFFGQHLAAGES